MNMEATKKQGVRFTAYRCSGKSGSVNWKARWKRKRKYIEMRIVKILQVLTTSFEGI